MRPTVFAEQELQLPRSVTALPQRLGSKLGVSATIWSLDGHLLCPKVGEVADLCGLPFGPASEALRPLVFRAVKQEEPIAEDVLEGVATVALPLRSRRKVLGVICLAVPRSDAACTEEFQRQAGRFGVDAQAVLAVLRRRAACSMPSAALVGLGEILVTQLSHNWALADEVDSLGKNLAETYEEISLLYKHGSRMTISRGPEQFLRDAGDDLLEVANIEGMVFVLFEPESDPPIARQVIVCGRAPVAQFDLPEVYQPHLQRLTVQRLPLVDNSFAPRPPLRPVLGRIRSLLMVPVVHHDRCFGLIAAFNKRDGHEFSSVDTKLIEAIANHAGVFLLNVELYDDLRELMTGLVRALTSSLDAKDPYTCGHSERVALLAKRIAEAMGLSEGDQELFYLAGLLHDVGKIGVPESVLLKEGKLTAEEFDAVKRHPDIGGKILGGIKQLEAICQGVRYHHEKYNGTGYPDGLAGEEIPLLGRVICLADSFDAMTSDRCYRKGLGLDTAIEEIRRSAGTHFDPKVVEALLSTDVYRLREELYTAAPPLAQATTKRE
jgi:hypothetical protein